MATSGNAKRRVGLQRRDFATAAAATMAAAAGSALAIRDSPLRIREEPLKFDIQPLPHAGHGILRDVLPVVHERLKWRMQMSYGDLLHWLEVFAGMGRPYSSAASTSEVIKLLTNAKLIERRYGQSGVIVKTQEGIRFLSSRDEVGMRREACPAHSYQETAVFGAIGLPSSSTVVTDKGDFRIEDAVRHCVRNMQIRESLRLEPEWPTKVLAHYLLPIDRWRNRWGEEITLEKWGEFLIGRDSARYSCGGTHLIHSTALLFQAGRRYGAISLSLTRRLRDLFRSIARTLDATQKPDGAWQADWANRDVAPESTWASVLVTGHILESQLFLPDDLRASDRCLKRALEFVSRAFLESSDDEVQKNYCAFSHAGKTLLVCSSGA